MYNTPQDKSSRKPYSNKPSKASGSDRWDHGGFDQLQSEHDARQKNDDKFKKSRKFPNDSTMASDILQNNSNNHPSVTSNKWTHDKFAEVSNPQQTTQNGQSFHEKEKPQKPARRERKPDQPLYSVRRKLNNEEPKPRDSAKKGAEEKETQERGKTTLLSDEVMRGHRGSEKEIVLNEDDTKSVISNVSTAISDPLKGYEEEGSIVKVNGEAAKKEPGLLFELVLDTEKMDVVKIYENEADYEGFLDSLCGRYGMGKRMGLYFKINMLETIMEVHPDPAKIEPLLDKLLEMNYKIMMADQEPENIDQEILPYLDDEEEILCELDPEWNQEEDSSL